MKISVFGAGAIGGFFAARLAHAGFGVSVVARGQTLKAIAANGLVLHTGDETIIGEVRAHDVPATLGVHDVVILAVKSPALPTAAALARPLIGPDTVVVPALNGVPWWFFLDSDGPLSGTRLTEVDPSGAIEAAIPSSSVVGCVVFPACSTLAPGVVRHASGNRIVFGEPRGGSSARVALLTDAFRHSGLDAVASDDIRHDVWLKLLGNACFNPVSLLTGCSTDRLIDDKHVHHLFEGVISELIALGSALGVDVAIEPSERLALTRRLGEVKTSMLQDVEAGRTVELEAILGTVIGISRRLGHRTLRLDAVYALARMRAAVLGLLPSN